MQIYILTYIQGTMEKWMRWSFSFVIVCIMNYCKQKNKYSWNYSCNQRQFVITEREMTDILLEYIFKKLLLYIKSKWDAANMDNL